MIKDQPVKKKKFDLENNTFLIPNSFFPHCIQ